MTVPECVHIPPLPEPLQSQTHSVLSMVRQDQGLQGRWDGVSCLAVVPAPLCSCRSWIQTWSWRILPSRHPQRMLPP